MLSSSQPTVPSPPQHITRNSGASLNMFKGLDGPPQVILYTYTCKKYAMFIETIFSKQCLARSLQFSSNLARIEEVLKFSIQLDSLVAPTFWVDKNKQRLRMWQWGDLKRHWTWAVWRFNNCIWTCSLTLVTSIKPNCENNNIIWRSFDLLHKNLGLFHDVRKNGTLQCSIKKEQKSSPEMALSFQTFF